MNKKSDPHLFELSHAVLLRLRHVEDLVHEGLRSSAVQQGEDAGGGRQHQGEGQQGRGHGQGRGGRHAAALWRILSGLEVKGWPCSPTHGQVHDDRVLALPGLLKKKSISFA